MNSINFFHFNWPEQVVPVAFRSCLGLVMLIIGLTSPAVAYDGESETPPPDYYCHEEERFLTDQELIERAFQFEVNERQLPEPFITLGFEGLQELNPKCCGVARENYELNQDIDTFWERLLTRKVIFVTLRWPSESLTEHFDQPRTSYHLGECGEVLEYWGDFNE